MSDDQQWIKLFRYLDKRFGEVDAQFTAVHHRLDQHQTSLDGIAKRLDDDDIERAAMNAQLNRHETWLHHLARKVGTKLS